MEAGEDDTRSAEHLFTRWYENEKVKYGIERSPKLLSFLAFHNPQTRRSPA